MPGATALLVEAPVYLQYNRRAWDAQVCCEDMLMRHIVRLMSLFTVMFLFTLPILADCEHNGKKYPESSTLCFDGTTHRRQAVLYRHSALNVRHVQP